MHTSFKGGSQYYRENRFSISKRQPFETFNKYVVQENKDEFIFRYNLPLRYNEDYVPMCQTRCEAKELC